MSLELTTNDLVALEQYRLQRFRSFFFSTLMSCPLCLDEHQTLIIHCLEPQFVDQLLTQMDQLRWYARIVLGVSCLAVNFVQEEIYRTATDIAYC
ncbi:MAG: hypothetical protein RBJ76_26520 [Stenomitos frigidus ULC029]